MLRRRLRREDGMALVVALGFSLMLGISGSTAVAYSTSNYGSAARSKADRSAQSLAEAGLAAAYSTLYNSGSPTMPNAVPEQSHELDGGTVTYSGTLNGSTWTLTGIGRVPNPTGRPSELVRLVRGRVSVGSSQQGTSNNAVWNYVYSDSVDTCMPLQNSVVVDVPLYVRGNLCLQNSAKFTGPVLQVGGTVTLQNSSSIGSSGTPIPEIHVGDGCKKGANQLHDPCIAADGVYGSLVDSAPAGLTKPPIDLAGWYQNSFPGPMHGCTTGSFPGGFDNDTVMNRSRGTVNLIPDGVPYDCTVLDGSGNVMGRIAWTGVNGGTLTISGTLFFDGDIIMTNSQKATYQGKATIYTSGKIAFQNSNDLCGSPNCDGAWDPTQNLLALVAGSSTDATGIDMANSVRFQGATYAVNDYRQGNSVVVWGPVVARQIYLQNSTQNHYVPLGTLLPGMPATYEEVIALTNEPGSWG